MDEEQFYTIILRHDTSTLWMTNDPILSLGEYGVEDDTHKVKRGDGESKWSELSYEDFGLQYIVTFNNLHGELSDNETLTTEFDKKISKSIFRDTNNSVVGSLILTTGDSSDICTLTKLTKDVVLGGSSKSIVQILSSDNSVQGYWSIEDDNTQLLNLLARSVITDYEPDHTYYRNHLCYYNKKLYRAVTQFTAEPTFNETQWTLLASLHSEDIKYDNLSSGLDSENVKDALDELKRRDDRKVLKSTEERIVYGTDAFGNQTVIPIDDLRKVDTVNHQRADANKNVQIDASQINYSDANPENGTVRTVLDSKVDKTFAGQGAKIVRDVRFNYNEATGHIELVEDKVSPEDGSVGVESTEIDVVSEQELSTNVTTINTRITDEVNTLNTRITGEVTTLNTRIDDEVNTLNDRIGSEVDTLNNTINTKETAIYNKITEEHNEINARVDEEVETLNNTITAKEQALQNQIDTNASEIARVETERTDEDERIEQESKDRDTALNTQINNAVNTLNNTILYQVDIINDRIDDEVETLNTSITTKETAINDRIDSEVNTLNTTITDEITTLSQTLNNRIDDEVSTLNTTIATEDNKKVDKDISEYLVTNMEASSDDGEPTFKITKNNTSTKAQTISHLHFKTNGLIKTSLQDADHIVIDSTDIDAVNTQQNTRLTNAENRLNAHDTQVASLLEHDVNHDRELASHSAQLSNHETRMLQAENDIIDLRTDLTDEVTDRTTADANLSTRIADNAVRIANNTQSIRDNADSINNLSETLETNITALTNSKADKTFASTTNNNVIGNIESDNISGSELFVLKKTKVSPVDGTSSTENIRVISSDGTVVATRNNDGTIDLATNLDTDVNYFVTTEIISTTIADETELDIANLTPTDKVNVEVQDIISDPEGTWGRVKSIDTVNNTCIVITFKKHAQAVWGTIKGDIADQTDLQNQFTVVENRLQGNIDTEASTRSSADLTLQNNIDAEELARQTADTTLQTNIDNVASDLTTEVSSRESADTILQNNIDAEVTNRTNADTTLQTNINNVDNAKVDKTTDSNKIYGTDSTGEQTTYDKDSFGKVDTVNNVQPDSNKNVTITAQDITYSGNTNIYDYVNNINTQVSNLITDLQSQITVYAQDTQYTSTGNYIVEKFVTITRSDGIQLMAKVLKNFTSDNTHATDFDCFAYDVEEGNLKLIGIPEQIGE